MKRYASSLGPPVKSSHRTVVATVAHAEKICGTFQEAVRQSMALLALRLPRLAGTCAQGFQPSTA